MSVLYARNGFWGAIFLVDGANISGGKVNTWAEVAGLSVTDSTVTTTNRMHKQNGMDSSFEDRESLKEFNEFDSVVPYIS